MPTVNEVFNLSDNFTLEELKNSFKKKVDLVIRSNLNRIDKELLIDEYNQYYKLGTQIYWSKTNIGMESQKANRSTELNKIKFPQNNLSVFNPFDEQNIFDQINSRFMDPIYRFDNVFNELNQINSNFNKSIESSQFSSPQIYSYSSTYKSKTNPDGSTTIIESKSQSTNGDNKKMFNAYKKMPDGRVIPFREEEIN